MNDYLRKIDVSIKNLRFQSYDVASNMSGRFNDLAARFKQIEHRELYVHTLSLASSWTCEEIKRLRDTLGTINNLYYII